MQKTQIFAFIITLLFVSCFPEGGSDNSSIKAEAELNGQNWSTNTGSFEITPNGIEIVVAGNGVVLIFKLNELKEAEFDLSETGNQVFFIADGQSTIITEGIVDINSVSENTISGTFEFAYEAKREGEYNIEAHYGQLYSLQKLDGSFTEEKTIEKDKFMFVDGKAGKIDIQETTCTINFTNESFKLEVDGFEDKNLELKISEIDESPTSTILHINNSTVKSISIDKMNNNNVSILFKNGTSLTLQ